MLGLLLTLLFYFAPTLVAYVKGHKQRDVILVLNLIFGWTLIGWVLCLIWSLLK
jgi:hypothetical protein